MATTTNLLTATEAAALLDVHVATLHRWCNRGLVPAIQPLPFSPRRFRREDIEALLTPRLADATAS